MARVILGIRLDVSGIEEIEKKKAYIFMSNHLSIIDGPLLFMLIPQSLRVIIKKEAFRIPIIAQAMRQAGFIPVDRKRLKGGKESIERASRMIREKGFSFLIFPEGTRSRDGELQPFKRGGIFLALNSKVDIFPVTIKGTYKMMPKGSFFIKKGNVRVVFHPPVSVEGFDQQNRSLLVDKVRDIIKTGLAE
jgi:1-acyl-sn-glycerol-3-phosphate acyltransferase